MQQEAAETLALRALGWLTGQKDLLGMFMGSTGSSPQDLRNRPGDPEFLGSVLDFLMMNDQWIMAFCDDEAIAYGDPMAARQALPGGAQINWT